MGIGGRKSKTFQMPEIEKVDLVLEITKVVREVRCTLCGNKWNYTGALGRARATCTYCGYKTRIIPLPEKPSQTAHCEACNWTWGYTGKRAITICPNCGARVYLVKRMRSIDRISEELKRAANGNDILSSEKIRDSFFSIGIMGSGTISRWVRILELRGKIKRVDFGNWKIIEVPPATSDKNISSQGSVPSEEENKLGSYPPNLPEGTEERK